MVCLVGMLWLATSPYFTPHRRLATLPIWSFVSPVEIPSFAASAQMDVSGPRTLVLILCVAIVRPVSGSMELSIAVATTIAWSPTDVPGAGAPRRLSDAALLCVSLMRSAYVLDRITPSELSDGFHLVLAHVLHLDFSEDHAFLDFRTDESALLLVRGVLEPFRQ